MGFSRKKRAFLVGVLGEEKTADLERRYRDRSRELEAMGVDFKAISDDLDAAVNGKVARGTTERKEPAEKAIDWTPRRRTPTGTAEKKERPLPLVDALVNDLTGQQEGGGS